MNGISYINRKEINMKNWKTVTGQGIISLHDHRITRVEWGDRGGKLVLHFAGGFDVMAGHPCNDTGRHKRTGEAAVILWDGELLDGRVRERTKNPPPLSADWLEGGPEVLDFAFSPERQEALLEFDSRRLEGIAEMRFRCSRVEYCWDRFVEDAWFQPADPEELKADVLSALWEKDEQAFWGAGMRWARSAHISQWSGQISWLISLAEGMDWPLTLGRLLVERRELDGLREDLTRAIDLLPGDSLYTGAALAALTVLEHGQACDPDVACARGRSLVFREGKWMLEGMRSAGAFKGPPLLARFAGNPGLCWEKLDAPGEYGWVGENDWHRQEIRLTLCPGVGMTALDIRLELLEGGSAREEHWQLKDWQADSPPAVGNWWRYRCHDGRICRICVYAERQEGEETLLQLSEAIWRQDRS